MNESSLSQDSELHVLSNSLANGGAQAPVRQMKTCSAKKYEEGVSMKDIESSADVRLLVDEFYGAIRGDALLNPIFTDIAKVDWEQHLPKMYAFWTR